MSHDFELKRLNEKLKEFDQESELLTHNMMRTRRDEQIDLDRVRREFDVRISMMETRQTAIIKEKKAAKREFESLKRRIEDEEDEEKEEERLEKQEASRRRLR